MCRVSIVFYSIEKKNSKFLFVYCLGNLRIFSWRLEAKSNFVRTYMYSNNMDGPNSTKSKENFWGSNQTLKLIHCDQLFSFFSAHTFSSSRIPLSVIILLLVFSSSWIYSRILKYPRMRKKRPRFFFFLFVRFLLNYSKTKTKKIYIYKTKKSDPIWWWLLVILRWFVVVVCRSIYIVPLLLQLSTSLTTTTTSTMTIWRQRLICRSNKS